MDPQREVLEYASSPRRRPTRRLARQADVVFWLMPAWCAAIVAIPFISSPRLRDDPFWFAAIGLAAVCALICAVQRRRWLLTLYCVGTGAFFAVVAGVIAPLLYYLFAN